MMIEIPGAWRAGGDGHRDPTGLAIKLKILTVLQSRATGTMVSRVGRYGVLLAGSRVFIRMVQQITGYQGLPQTATAIAPPA